MTVPGPFERQGAQRREEEWDEKQVIGVSCVLVFPSEAGEPERGGTEEPAASQRERGSLFARIHIIEQNVQRVDAF